MQKKLLCLPLFILGYLSYAQVCPTVISPANGANNVAVNPTITWEPVPGVPGYLVSLGTTPGGTELIDNQAVGSATSYTPPLGLPESTEIYITLTLFFFDRPNITCASQRFRTQDITNPPGCTTLTTPLDNAIDVNGGTNIRWNYAPTATGYRIRIGTALGTGDLIPDTDLGNVLFYNPPTDLPPNSEIFVRVTPYNENNLAPDCSEVRFITGALAALPNCATMISPANGEVNVPLTPLLEWTEVPGATSYRVSIGSTPFIEDVLSNAIFYTNSTFVLDFEPNRTFFINIVPQNASGEAIGCGQESFSTLLGCGPYFDLFSGALITLNPIIDFPDVVSFCENDAPYTISSPDNASGYRWFRVETDSQETLVSTSSDLSLTETGTYRYEVFNTVSTAQGLIECPTSKFFNVVSSEIATIANLDVRNLSDGLQLTVITNGIGDYEFSLNDINGPYQDSNMFSAVPVGTNTVYVRDKNGCGIAEETKEPDLTLEGFPKFFTPNNDLTNDYWQFIPPLGQPEIPFQYIQIFNRFGAFVSQIDPQSPGWDGTLNGKPLPPSDYWFKAVDSDGREIKGHFSLKR